MGKYNEEQICKEYKESIMPKKIIDKHNLKRTTFYKILKRNGVETFKKGHFHKNKTPWNKGLTKKDPGVRKYHKKGVKTRKKKGSYKPNSGTFKEGQTRAHYPKGRPNP
ncbi:MAG: hypothetical protein ACOCTT_03405, partial [archaeon]